MPAPRAGGATGAGREIGTGRDVLDALAGRPGGRALLAAAEAGADLALVGGAVRDLLLGREPRELDVVAGAGIDTRALAAELAGALGATTGDTTHHDRFGTAAIEWPGGRIDLARRRAETYARPGALPDVTDGSPEDDLRRRDFSVNALVVPLAGAAAGELQGAVGATEDLRAGRLRVLHDDSFRDDPTRLLRLARYSARLAFAIEPHTRALAADAVAGGALSTVSGARTGAELRLALAEPDPLAALAALDDLGLLAAIDASLVLRAGLAERALALLPAEARRETTVLASLLPQGPGPQARAGRELLDRLEFPASERDTALEAAAHANELAQAVAQASRPSQLHAALAGRAPEAVALAGATGDGAGAKGVREWLTSLRHIGLQINGDDLLAAGVAAGPEVGVRLAAALRQRLDGELGDEREPQLRAALEARA